MIQCAQVWAYIGHRLNVSKPYKYTMIVCITLVGQFPFPSFLVQFVSYLFIIAIKTYLLRDIRVLSFKALNLYKVDWFRFT